jgi:hypothetical protein
MDLLAPDSAKEGFDRAVGIDDRWIVTFFTWPCFDRSRMETILSRMGVPFRLEIGRYLMFVGDTKVDC